MPRTSWVATWEGDGRMAEEGEGVEKYEWIVTGLSWRCERSTGNLAHHSNSYEWCPMGTRFIGMIA